MAEQEPKTLEDIDKNTDDALLSLDQMLAAEDPDFATEMKDVQEVGAATDVIIEASAIDTDEEIKEDGKKDPFIKRLILGPINLLKLKIKLFARNLVYQSKNFAIWLFQQLKIWIPIALKAALEFVKSNIKAFGKLTNVQKLALVSTLALLVVMFFLFKINVKGQWIPLFNKPELQRFSAIADSEIDVGKDKEFIPLYTAFSLPHFEYLLPKFKANLKPTPTNAWPMAAMELIITLDTRETAVELKDREAAVFDRVQRVIESVTYEQMDSALGKEHLKTLIKKELNTILTQGWVEDINYKTLVIKP